MVGKKILKKNVNWQFYENWYDNVCSNKLLIDD